MSACPKELDHLIVDPDQKRVIGEVARLLDSTRIERWSQGGEELVPEKRYDYSRETWERVFRMPLPDATLVLRSSQPVTERYYGGGFRFDPHGDCNYTVEMRAPGWKHEELTDPGYREGVTSTRCDELADGVIAKYFFDRISERYETHLTTVEAEFAETTEKFLAELSGQLKAHCYYWKKEELHNNGVKYVGEVGEYRISVLKEYPRDMETFSVEVERGDRQYICRDRTLAKNLFQEAGELNTTSRLSTLQTALSKAGNLG